MQVPPLIAVLGRIPVSDNGTKFNYQASYDGNDIIDTYIMKFLQHHTGLNNDLPPVALKNMENQLKKVSHIITEQVFFKMELGTTVLFVEVHNKSTTIVSSEQFIRLSRRRKDIEYGSESVLSRSTIITKLGFFWQNYKFKQENFS